MEGDPKGRKGKEHEKNFYPRPHMEGDTVTSYGERYGFKFLPTPSHGGRLVIDTNHLFLDDFYPRPHMEGDLTVSLNVFLSWEFLPTPSHGGRRFSVAVDRGDGDNFYPRPHMEGDVFVYAQNYPFTHFYPRPHMEGDMILGRSFVVEQISTHALTWRATLIGGNLDVLCRKISTHALTWRATSGRWRWSYLRSRFLPTPSHGGRLC